jgi:D-alanine-D-alanine ligase
MKTIGIFCGGFSSEFDISIKSATTILQHMPPTFSAYKIIVSKEKWEVETEEGAKVFDLNDCSFVKGNTKITLDAAIVYIHGDPGENGKIQAMLELHGIKYINSGPLASALSFDKWYCNQFLKSFDIPVAKSLFLTKKEQFTPTEIVENLGLPLFIKPSDSGSSYGISKVKNIEEIPNALTLAFKEGGTVVIESFLDGIEVTCGVYRSSKGISTLPLTEIVSENDFFDYEAKYNGKSNEITPARVDDAIAAEVQSMAKEIYSLLQLRSIARVDFMLVKNKPYVIEVNTTPGFSAASIVPQMLAAAKISLDEFWEDIISIELD